MYDNNSKGISYTAGFFMLIAFAIACIIAAGLISEPIWRAMTGKSIEVIRDNAVQPSDSDAMKVMQVIAALVGFLLPGIITASMLSRKPFQLLGFSTGARPNQAGITLVIILVAMAISIFALAYLNRLIPLPADWKIRADQWEADYNRQAQAILSLKTSKDYVIALIVMAFLPAVCEEALFRGGLQNFLTRSTGRPILSIIVVSLIFSAVHASFYGFLPRLFLGAVLGIIFHYSGKLWLSILAHFINNGLAITILFLSVRQGRPMEETMQQNSSSWWGILLLPALVALIIHFRKISAPVNSLR